MIEHGITCFVGIFNIAFILLSKILSTRRFQTDLSATYFIDSKKDSRSEPIPLLVNFIEKLPDLSTTFDQFLEINLQLNRLFFRLSRMNKRR